MTLELGRGLEKFRGARQEKLGLPLTDCQQKYEYWGRVKMAEQEDMQFASPRNYIKNTSTNGTVIT